jgi:hypothetical protein
MEAIATFGFTERQARFLAADFPQHRYASAYPRK